jgi:RNA polymerase sigma factor (sigma-70 family)
VEAAIVTSSNNRFDKAVMPHLDAAFNLARWLLGDDNAARDVVQNAAIRALQYLGSLRGDEGRSWFLGIVRNVAMDALKERSARSRDLDVDEMADSELPAVDEHIGPVAELERRATRDEVNIVLRMLPVAYREVLVLREMEDMTYDEIASVTGTPLGTVMSRLARARRRFRDDFLSRQADGVG